MPDTQNMDNYIRELMRRARESYKKVCPIVSEEISKEEVWLTAPGGIKLRTVITKPVEITGPYPTLVMRSCYPNQEALLQNRAEGFAQHGFAAVVQWCRGINGSEGQWEPNIYDRDDGLSLVNWLQEQDWVKNMGYVGASYLAMTGWIMADAVPDKMKTMYLTVYGTVRHTSAWKDGLFRQDILTAWAKDNAGFPVSADFLESARYRPQVEVDEALWGSKLPWYRDWITHPSVKDPYWDEGHWAMLRDIPAKLKIPVFVGEGWYDHHLGSMLEGYASLSETAKQHSVFQISPTNHGAMPVIPGVQKQAHAAIDEDEQQMRWFYDILVKEQLPEPAVQYYIIGADKWHTYKDFPPKPAGEKLFYLSDHTLTDIPGEESARSYIYDPEDPVPSHGGESLFQSWGHIGALEQPGPNWRQDILSYTSQPLECPLSIVGPIQVKLWVESDAPDTCFAVKLMEVFPDGRAFHIRGGITTLAWRNGATEPQHYDGSPVEVTISCWDVAWQLQPGSRLRLDVTSSNFPEYSVHPNTTTLWSLAAETRTARQTVLTGKAYPSKIILPVDK